MLKIDVPKIIELCEEAEREAAKKKIDRDKKEAVRAWRQLIKSILIKKFI